MSKLSNRLNERFEGDPPDTITWGWFVEDELQEVISLESELALLRRAEQQLVAYTQELVRLDLAGSVLRHVHGMQHDYTEAHKLFDALPEELQLLVNARRLEQDA